MMATPEGRKPTDNFFSPNLMFSQLYGNIIPNPRNAPLISHLHMVNFFYGGIFYSAMVKVLCVFRGEKQKLWRILFRHHMSVKLFPLETKIRNLQLK